MNVLQSIDQFDVRLAHARRIWLFLDYDGTLAEFTPTPEDINPVPEVVELVAGLAALSRLRVTILSGRPLHQLQVLIPVPDVTLAGTYGIEFQTQQGKIINRLDLASVRPPLDELKPYWETLIAGRQGYFLEDKGWTLALHARFASADEAESVLASARSAASEVLPFPPFRILEGDRFFEVGPDLANKGLMVKYLLEVDPWDDAVLVYLGDDARDEEAFEVIRALGGVTVLVALHRRDTVAEHHLSKPSEVRRWLVTLLRN